MLIPESKTECSILIKLVDLGASVLIKDAVRLALM